MGSSLKMKGKILVLSIFLNDDESSWTLEDQIKVQDALNKATDFLKNQAKLYETFLDFYINYDFMSTSLHTAFLNYDFYNDVMKHKKYGLKRSIS